METSTTRVKMISFKGNNLMIWKAKKDDLLYPKDLYAPVEGDPAKSETMSADNWTKLNHGPSVLFGNG